MSRCIFYMCLFALFLSRSAHAQTSLNPDISAIGSFQAYSHDDVSRNAEYKRLSIDDPEVELNIGGYLNPYARADIVFGWHGEHNAEVEEAFATVMRGLPLNANLRVGKYLLEFGRLNPKHPHAYSFIKRPLPHAALFGEEGLSDMAARVSVALPTGAAFTEIMGGLLKGDALSGHEHEHAEGESETKKHPGFFGRVTTSGAISASSELAIGGSVLNAVHEIFEDTLLSQRQLRSWIMGGDAKYTYKPSRYRSLHIEAEGMMRRSDLDEENETATSYGVYGYLDYRFNQVYNIGAIAEWVRLEEEHHDGEEDGHGLLKNDTERFGLFIGFAPFEETSVVRLVGHWTDPGDGAGFWEATLQFMISLGPHKPHSF